MNIEDFHNRLNDLYLPPKDQFTVIDVPEIRFAVIDGAGNPENGGTAEAVKWLYAIAHVVKPLVKERMGKNFVEPPPEFLYWADNAEDFVEGRKDKWKWRVMLVFIDWITNELFEEAVAKVESRRGPAPDSLRIQHLHEGKSVQIMHVGNYEKVGAVCEKLYNDFLPENSLVPNGYYHEIYLNDPKRTAPEKRKVVIRQPVK